MASKVEMGVAHTNAGAATGEFGRGWQLLLAAMMGTSLSATLPYALGVFISPIGKDYGWDAEVIIAGLTLSTVLSGLGALFCGRLIARFGARRLAVTGILILTSATVALGLIPRSLPAYFACYAVVALAHMLLSPIVWQKIVVERFVKARGLAMSIVLCGPNIAGSIAPLLSTVVIQRADWHTAYLVLALYMLVATLPLTLLYFRELPIRATSLGTAAEGGEPGRTSPTLKLADVTKVREFWLLTASFALAGIGLGGYTVHFVPLLLSKGLPLLLAASMMSALSIAAICGRILAGVAIDRLFAPRIAAIALTLPVLSSVLLLFLAPAAWAILAAAVLLGLSSGAEYNMLGYLTARYFGLRNFGTVGSILFCGFTLGCVVGQLFPGVMLRTGTYDNVAVFFGATFLTAAVLMLFCRAYPQLAAEDAG